ncbi:MAG: protein-export chaperone SecB [Gammaproteobacteria bacterium]|nr:protein-export chaperone SecB [Gammaproteobacteria bacterium]
MTKKDIQKLLDSANKKISLDNVALTSINFKRDRELMPIVRIAVDKMKLLKHNDSLPVNTTVIEFPNNNTGKTVYVTVIEYTVAVEILDESKENTYATIELSVQAEYLSNEKPSEEEVKVYAEHNSLVHVYPYIRNFIHNITKDAGLPPIVMPIKPPIMATA